jgi:ATPase subunit of ABC transporter with duplicated ATPase domains
VFAEICWKNPHILLLDEPTNHLDMDTIEALIEALREFKGGVILISHHQRLIEAACKEVWVVKSNRVERFEGDFDTYKKMILRTMPATDGD